MFKVETENKVDLTQLQKVNFFFQVTIFSSHKLP